MEKKEHQQITLESSLKTICFPNGNYNHIFVYNVNIELYNYPNFSELGDPCLPPWH